MNSNGYGGVAAQQSAVRKFAFGYVPVKGS